MKKKGRMETKQTKLRKQPTKLKIYFLTSAFLLPLCSFAQDNNTAEKDTDTKRVEIDYTQRHSRKSGDSYKGLLADGIKIKRDLSLIEEVQESRIFDLEGIPADDIYGGIWSNSRVNAYADLTEIPDTFNVDLTNFTIPTMGHVTSNFGKRRRRMHYGIDLKVQTGDTIYAAFDGKIRLCQYERRGYGYYVVMRHQNGLETVYGHLSKFLVKEDDVVKTGDPIALGGNTGRSTGSHLHLEFRFLGRPIDPNFIVDFNNKVCHRDTYTVTPRSFNYIAAPSSKTGVTKTTYANYQRSNNTNKYVSGSVAYHRVKKGDSLYKIAKAYGTTVKNLCRLNNLSERSMLRLGQAIRIS